MSIRGHSLPQTTELQCRRSEARTDLDIRIERLEPMWVAAVHAFGRRPEAEAWRRLRQWAGPKGLMTDPVVHPIFGFNNPNPHPGRASYGYELWIRVDGPEAGDDEVGFIKQFEGGLFAVTTCKLGGDRDIGTTWRMLWEWAQHGSYRWRMAQELEKVVNPSAPDRELVLELYLPVRETGESRVMVARAN